MTPTPAKRLGMNVLMLLHCLSNIWQSRALHEPNVARTSVWGPRTSVTSCGPHTCSREGAHQLALVLMLRTGSRESLVIESFLAD